MGAMPGERCGLCGAEMASGYMRCQACGATRTEGKSDWIVAASWAVSFFVFFIFFAVFANTPPVLMAVGGSPLAGLAISLFVALLCKKLIGSLGKTRVRYWR